jgi:hypothetical protein
MSKKKVAFLFILHNRRKQFLHLLLMLLVFNSCGMQTPNDYQETFDWMVKTIEENDAGFQCVIDFKGIEDYKVYTASLRKKIGSASNQKECSRIMCEWLYYFRQGHIGISINNRRRKLSLQECLKNKTILYKLSNQTVYFKISSLKHGNKKLIDELLSENASLIRSTQNLIIDIRDSKGGSDYAYDNLIPFLYTNPIRYFGVEYRASELNAKALEDFAQIADSSFFIQAAAKLRNNFGQFVRIQDSIMIEKRDTIYAYPKNVGVICHSRNGSADESFLMTVKQSKKVKVFGTPTHGIFDFSNLNFVESPNGKFKLHYAMSRNLLWPDYCIDNVGIQPDYYLDESIKDWVAYTKDILEY